MVDVPSGPPGTVAATESRDVRPTVETQQIRPAAERAETRDARSESRERRIDEHRQQRLERTAETRQSEAVRAAEETAKAAKKFNPADVAVLINEQRLIRLSELTDLRNVSSGVGTTATAVELADDANKKVSSEIAEIGKVATAVAKTEDLKADDRKALAREARNAADRIDDIAAETRFNDRALVDGSEDAESSGFGSLTAEHLGVDDLDFADEEAASRSKESVERADEAVRVNRAGLRDTRAALEEVISQISESSGALSSDNGRSGDAEMVREQADRLAEQIRSQPGVAALATSNAAPVGVLSVLIGG